MNCTVLDFETYYDRQYGLKGMSIPEYVHDHRFHVQGLAIRWHSGETQFRVDVECVLGELRQRFGDELEKTTVVGHHTQFDLYILSHRYGIRPPPFHRYHAARTPGSRSPGPKQWPECCARCFSQALRPAGQG